MRPQWYPYQLFNVTLTVLLMDIEEVIHIIRMKYQNKKNI